jgi:hypothetical protein
MPLLSWGRRNPRRGGAVPRGGFALQSWKDDQWSKSWPDIHRVEQFSRRRCATADLALGRQNNAFGLLLSAFPRLSTMRVSLALLAAALLLGTALCSATDPPQCSGHGTLVDGKCRCDNPWPQEGGQGGWTGPECSIPVYRGKPDGADMAAACGDCASLQPGDWACFAVRAPWNDSSFNYLTVLLNRTSADERGDPDLFGAPGCGAGGGALMLEPGRRPHEALVGPLLAVLPVPPPPNVCPPKCAHTHARRHVDWGVWRLGCAQQDCSGI